MGSIRFLLAFSVLILHSSPIAGIRLLPGETAVRTFYIISGFYMTLIFSTKYASATRPYYSFITNRWLRLYPPYLVVVLLIGVLSVAYGIWLGSFGKIQYYLDWYRQVPESLSSLLTVLFFNISLIGQDWITFFLIDENGHLQFMGLVSEIKLQELLFVTIAWTVAVEFFFYLLTPLIANRGIRVVLYWLAAVVALRLFLFLVFDVGGHLGIYRFAPTELMWFLMGMLSYKLYEMKWLPGATHGLFYLTIFLISFFSFPLVKSEWLVFAIAFIFMPAVFYRFSGNKYDRYLGELAFPMYISHMLFLMVVNANRFPKPFGPGLPLFVLTFVFSLIFVKYFLNPLNRYRERRLKVLG